MFAQNTDAANPSFTFEGQTLRGVILDGLPWFVAADVCRVLGLDTTKGTFKHLAKLDADERCYATRDSHPELFSGT